MITKIETQEIMTRRAARVKYRDKFFQMVITEIVDTQDNDLGYVTYTYDNRNEMLDVPNDYPPETIYGHCLGIAAEPELQIGGLTYYVFNKN
ncbi:MAG: hypothetical protein FWB71_06200 [Defluviitaleaceae bacterium]|nr:hypothetical protein [Defluviitaleaceae bacterium]